MSVLVVGLDYKRAPLEILERLTFAPADLPKALHGLRSSPHISEVVILSTCNRSEIYVAVDAYHAGVAELRRFFGEFHHVPLEDFGNRLALRHGDDAVAHLFSVAAGIESMAVGEPQILQQVRAALRAAAAEDAAGPVLSSLFRHAVRVGRRARSETGIARSAATFARAGAALAREALGELRSRTVLLVGAGKMGDLAAGELVEEGAEVLVANRTHARAQSLAVRAGGEAVPISELAAALRRADLVLTSTGSHEPLITTELVSEAMAWRAGRGLIILDLAVPRDVDPSAGSVPGVTLRDLDDLRGAVAPDADQLREVERVRAIVADEVPRFDAWQRAHSLAPLLEALLGSAERIRAAEMKRVQPILDRMSEPERAALETMTRSIVRKLMHDPVTALKRLAGTAEGEMLASALRVLFDLPREE